MVAARGDIHLQGVLDIQSEVERYEVVVRQHQIAHVEILLGPDRVVQDPPIGACRHLEWVRRDQFVGEPGVLVSELVVFSNVLVGLLGTDTRVGRHSPKKRIVRGIAVAYPAVTTRRWRIDPRTVPDTYGKRAFNSVSSADAVNTHSYRLGFTGAIVNDRQVFP
ncbi:hypothetical protein D3C76_1089620 [compost metagenome]